jgi:hypothetical protein
MAETYLGIGKLNFFLFLIIFVFIVGAVAQVFQAKDPASVTAQNSKFNQATTFKDKPAPTGNWLDTVTSGMGMVKTALGVFWAGLTLDIPDLPTAIRLIICVPVIIMFMVVLIDILVDVSDIAIKAFNALTKWF